MGRRYTLRVRKSSENSVTLKAGELIVKVENAKNTVQVKQVLGNWYYHHALEKFDKFMVQALQRFKTYKLEKPSLITRRMPRRWGSCTTNGRIIINPEIIKAPTKCIEYVIVHELCHLVHFNHDKAFYELQSKIMPDWKKWKLKLETTLS